MKFFVAFLINLSLNLLAADTVELQTTTDFAVTAKTSLGSSILSRTNENINLCSDAASGSGTINLNTVSPVGTGQSETNAATIYVPILNSVATYYNCNYFRLMNPNISGNLYRPLSRGAKAVGGALPTSTDHLNLLVKVSVGEDTAKFLYLAVKDTTSSTGYSVAAVFKFNGTGSPVVFPAGTLGSPVEFQISPAELCNYAGSNTAECSKDTGKLLSDSTAYTTTPLTLTAFLFVENDTLVPGDPAPAPSGYSGVYFKILMSNYVIKKANLRITINSLRNGDNRAVLNFTPSVKLGTSFFKEVGVYASGSATADMAIISELLTGGQLAGPFLTSSQEGDMTVFGLTNGQPYNLGVFLIDHFDFVTGVSQTSLAEPQDIQELLNKQSCFLLTAGFGEEHYVIDYFRHFRDKTLSKYFLGQQFIKYYYRYAPSFALSIYNNQAIRFCIRMMGYFLYFVFNYSMALVGFFGLFIILFRINRSKILKI